MMNMRRRSGSAAALVVRTRSAAVDPVHAHVDALLDKQGDRLFDQAGALLPAVNILKNGRNILFQDGLSTRLEEGDLIAVFPPVAGG